MGLANSFDRIVSGAIWNHWRWHVAVGYSLTRTQLTRVTKVNHRKVMFLDTISRIENKFLVLSRK